MASEARRTPLSEEWNQAYAELVLEAGVNLQPGQDLSLSAPIEAAPFVRCVVGAAYQRGARFVDLQWRDAWSDRARLDNSAREHLDYLDSYPVTGMTAIMERGGGRLVIQGDDPGALDGVDGEAKARVDRALRNASRRYSELGIGHKVNWCGVAWPTPGWARAVFPALESAAAQQNLAREIDLIMRLDREDPIAAWKDHVRSLAGRARWMTERRFDQLHLEGPGTDCRIGLAPGHLWETALATAANGVTGIVNLPTEEIYTAPDWRRARGVIRSSRPLVYRGMDVGNLELELADGRIVAARADGNDAVFQGWLDVDARARYLGELALVSQSSPLAQIRHAFGVVLYDENAGAHIAFGRAYPRTIQGGSQMDEAELLDAGANVSMTHIDFVVGSAELRVTGETADGDRVTLMDGGEFAGELLEL